MEEQRNASEYKKAVNNFGLLFVKRLLRPWLHLNWTYSLSQLSKEMSETVKVLHDFSSTIIQQRKKTFESESSSLPTKKRLALMDLLLKAQKARTIDIDDEGIREEVDTFIFGVRRVFVT